jgi:hypothetical protein
MKRIIPNLTKRLKDSDAEDLIHFYGAVRFKYLRGAPFPTSAHRFKRARTTHAAMMSEGSLIA